MPQTALGNRGLNYEHDLLSNDWKNGYDANWIITDSEGYVLEVRSAQPAGTPTVGSAYILGASPTGSDWGSDSRANENWVAIYAAIDGLTDGSDWIYLEPRDGWTVYNRATAERELLTYDGVEDRWISRAERQCAVTVIDDNGGDYTPGLAQENGAIILSSAYDATDDFVIPVESAVAYKIGTTIRVCNKTTAVTVSATGISFVGGGLGTLQPGTTELVKTGSDEWAALT